MRYLQGMRGRLERSLWACAVALGLAVVAATAWRMAVSPAGVLLPRAADAPWIAAPTPVTAQIHQWRKHDVPVVTFVATFERPEARSDPDDPLDPSGHPRLDRLERFELEVRALGDFSLFLNGRAVAVEVQEPGTGPRDWKRFRKLDVSRFVQDGTNSLRVNVRNPHGPGLLSLRLLAKSKGTRSLLLGTGEDWRVGVDAGDDLSSGRVRAWAALASDVRPHVTASLGERPFESIRRHGLGIVLWFALGVAGFLIWQRSTAARWASPDKLPLFAAGLVAAGWLYLFVSKFTALDLGVGFDAASHVAYADWLREKGTLPSASDGWSMYHPPLFYLVSVALAALAEALGSSREVALKLVPWLSGLALVAVSRSLVRKLMPGDSPAEAAAMLFSGFLPMNLYLAAYYTNEGFHAALAGLAIASGVGLLLGREVRRLDCALFSLWIGLALLAKFTAVVVAAVVGGAVALRAATLARSAGPFALRALWLVAPALLTAGWFYARNLALYGEPLVGNWDSSEPGRIWWSEPGFHTADYYLRFGESFSRPFLAGFVSFWDALYSTAWGDGLLAGQGGLRARHSLWNYEWMAAGYLLALPATLLLIAGFGNSCRELLRDREPLRRGALAVIVVLPCALGFATFWVTLELPYFGQAKAFYSLALIPVASFFFARALRGLDGWLSPGRAGRLTRALLFGWLAAFFGVAYLSFAA